MGVLRWRSARLGALGGLVALSTLAVQGQAYATTCIPNETLQNGQRVAYTYGGQGNNVTSHYGVDGMVGLGYKTVNAAIHDLDYLEIGGQISQTGCAYNLCYMQAGNGIGTVGNQTTSYVDPYMEEEDVNGYDPSFQTTSPNNACDTPQTYVSLFADSYYVNNNEQYDAVLQNSNCSYDLIGQAYLIGGGGRTIVPGTTEEEYVQTGACTAMSDYFGANNDGSSGTSTYLQASYGSGQYHTVYDQNNYSTAPDSINPGPGDVFQASGS